MLSPAAGKTSAPSTSAQVRPEGPPTASSLPWASREMEICGFSLAEPVVTLPQPAGSLALRRCDKGQAVRGRANRRSVAGEWLPWFARGGGPPDVREVPALHGVGGRAAVFGGSAARPTSYYLAYPVRLSMIIDLGGWRRSPFPCAQRVSSRVRQFTLLTGG